MKIRIGSDHRGFALKIELISLIQHMGYQYEDEGCFDEESADYPDPAGQVARKVAKETFDLGILICGTGIGMSIAANKVPGIRAALCSNELYAFKARQHNDANILCIGSEAMSSLQATEVVKTFLTTEFEGGRHVPRLEKIRRLEKDELTLC